MTDIEVRYRVDEVHELAAVQAAKERVNKLVDRERDGVAMQVLMTLLVAGALFGVYKVMTGRVASDFGWAALAIVLLATMLFLLGRRRQRAAWRLFLAGLGPHPYEETLRVDATHLTLANPRGVSSIPLARAIEVDVRPAEVILHIRPGVTLRVPRTAFVDDSQRDAFVEAVRGARGA